MSDEWQKDREVIDAASEGPWAWAQPCEKENGFVVGATDPPHSGFLKEPEPVYNEESGGYEFSDDDPEVVEQVCEQWGATVNYGDAEFITRARTRWPAALDEVERLREENARLMEWGEALSQSLSDTAAEFAALKRRLGEEAEGLSAAAEEAMRGVGRHQDSHKPGPPEPPRVRDV